MLDELKDVFELATGATAFVNSILELKKNNKKFNEDDAVIKSSGDSAQIGSSGDSARIGSSGDSAQIGSSGYSAQIESTGLKAAVAAIGFWAVAKGKKGSWLTLAEYRTDENNRLYPYFVKTEYIDGERIKEDTFYGLYNKEFREVIEVDGIRSLLISTKGNVQKVILNGDFEPSYIFTKDDIAAHGKSVKQAYRDWLFKQSDRDVSKYENLEPEEKHNVPFWYECYRTITGACALGTEHFIEQNKDRKEATLREVIELTKGQYGHNTFVEFFKEVL